MMLLNEKSGHLKVSRIHPFGQNEYLYNILCKSILWILRYFTGCENFDLIVAPVMGSKMC